MTDENLNEVLEDADSAVEETVPDAVSEAELEAYASTAPAVTSLDPATDKYRSRNPLATPVIAVACGVTALVLGYFAVTLFSPAEAPVEDVEAVEDVLPEVEALELELEPEVVPLPQPELEVVEESATTLTGGSEDTES